MADDEGTDELVVDEEAETPVEETPVSAPQEAPHLDPPKYEVRPGLGEKFQAEKVQEIIVTSMESLLSGQQYRSDRAPRWARDISSAVRHRTVELGMKRYKILVQTSILEMKGAGAKMGQRCLWDPETDDFVHESYKNETILCHCAVYGVYMY